MHAIATVCRSRQRTSILFIYYVECMKETRKKNTNKCTTHAKILISSAQYFFFVSLELSLHFILTKFPKQPFRYRCIFNLAYTNFPLFTRWKLLILQDNFQLPSIVWYYHYDFIDRAPAQCTCLQSIQWCVLDKQTAK